jgi:cbb3-type cytochrome oxidase subunit 3
VNLLSTGSSRAASLRWLVAMCYISAREKRWFSYCRPSQGIGKRVFGVHCNGTETAAELTLVARRNNSFSSGRRLLVLGSIALVVVAISVGFPFNGAWLVLLFAGLDLLEVVFAFRNVKRHSGDYECMIVRGDQLVFERWDRGSVSRFELNRTWALVGCPGAWKAAGWYCGPMETKWSSASI